MLPTARLWARQLRTRLVLLHGTTTPAAHADSPQLAPSAPRRADRTRAVHDVRGRHRRDPCSQPRYRPAEPSPLARLPRHPPRRPNRTAPARRHHHLPATGTRAPQLNSQPLLQIAFFLEGILLLERVIIDVINRLTGAETQRYQRHEDRGSQPAAHLASLHTSRQGSVSWDPKISTDLINLLRALAARSSAIQQGRQNRAKEGMREDVSVPVQLRPRFCTAAESRSVAMFLGEVSGRKVVDDDVHVAAHHVADALGTSGSPRDSQGGGCERPRCRRCARGSDRWWWLST